MPIIRDLIPDMTNFYKQYKEIKPWLHSNKKGNKEHIQSIEDRKKLDGMYEMHIVHAVRRLVQVIGGNSDDAV